MDNAILVPTDFSEVAQNAIQYAIGLAKQMQIKKIILFHAWQQPLVVNADIVNAELLNSEVIREASVDNLKEEKEKLETQLSGSGIDVESILEYGGLIQGIENLCEKVAISFVVMGVTGKGKFDESIIGSNSIDAAKKISKPVIIIPSSVQYSPIKKVVLSSDYKDIDTTLPKEVVNLLIAKTQAKLYVIHVDLGGELIDDKVRANANAKIEVLLRDSRPEFHVLHEPDYVEAINTFAKDHQVDLIVAIPKKKGFWENLFKPSRTKQLAFNGDTPMLVLHYPGETK